VPSARNIAVLVNPTYAEVEIQLKEVGQAAGTLGAMASIGQRPPSVPPCPMSPWPQILPKDVPQSLDRTR
jgi:hypothetical protein